jgi:hypothetical protein
MCHHAFLHELFPLVHYQLKQVFEILASELFLAIDGKLLPANGLFL